MKGTRESKKFGVECTVHHPTICIYINKMHKILVIRLFFLLDALHVSDCISSLDRWRALVRQLAGACEYGNELSGSIKCGEFLD
jgi:hypothetical protein